MGNNRRKGNAVENEGRKEVDKLLRDRGFTVYSTASRNSRGYADVVHIASKNGKYFPFGVQYKFGYESPKAIERSILGALKEYNLVLFYGVKKKTTTPIEYIPNIEKWVDDIDRSLVQ